MFMLLNTKTRPASPTRDVYKSLPFQILLRRISSVSVLGIRTFGSHDKKVLLSLIIKDSAKKRPYVYIIIQQLRAEIHDEIVNKYKFLFF